MVAALRRIVLWLVQIKDVYFLWHNSVVSNQIVLSQNFALQIGMEDSLKLESTHQQYQRISGISRTGASVHQQQQLMLVLILLMR